MKWLNINDRFLVPNSNVLLFRYLDSQFTLDLLKSNEIYFSKTSIHGEYAEGVLSKTEKVLLKKDYKNSFKNDWEECYKNTINKVNQYKEETFISCWNASQMENEHMWKTYTKTNDSCIIVTNTNLFLEALETV